MPKRVVLNLSENSGFESVKNVLRQWMKHIMSVLVMWAVASLITVTMSGGLDLHSWIFGQSEHEKGVDAHIIDSENAPSLANVGGMKYAKEEMLYNLVEPLKNPQVFFGGKRNFQAGHAILLFGPPGTGKTLLARAAAKESGAVFIAPTLAQLEAKYYGETAKILQATFSVAKRRAPSVIFFDEIDGIMRQRSSEEGCTYGLKTEMLRMLDSLKPKDAVVVIACTNNAALLDSALKRRMNVVVKVDLPNEHERAEIVKITSQEDAPSPRFLNIVSQQTTGFSGSDLQCVYKFACTARLRRVLRSRNGRVQDLLHQLPNLTDEEWLVAIQRMKLDKQSMTAETGGENGSTVDSLRSILQRIKDFKEKDSSQKCPVTPSEDEVAAPSEDGVCPSESPHDSYPCDEQIQNKPKQAT